MAGAWQIKCFRVDMTFSLLWIPVTLVAAAAQTARNATQRGLTEKIGIVGATQVRFLYGFPFALLALGLMRGLVSESIPEINSMFLGHVLFGAMSQIFATGLMLSAMRQRSFAVVTAYTKTEPVQVAVFGLLLLGDRLTASVALAILTATIGVLVVAVKSGSELKDAGWRPLIFGIVSGAFFALAAIGFRGAILSLEGSFLMRSTTTLTWSLGVQTAILVGWLSIFNQRALVSSFGAWKPSLGAGFFGALASQFWFIGFALTTAANVRTLALVEVIMAQLVSHRMAYTTTRRELVGMTLIVGGVGLLLWSQR